MDRSPNYETERLTNINPINELVADLAPFGIQPSDLEQIFILSQTRKKCEELDYLQQKQGLEWLYKGLLTSKQNGISKDTVKRTSIYGSNRRSVRAPKSYCSLLYDALQDFTMKILTVAAITSIVIEVATADPNRRSTAWIEGFAILIAVIVCTNVAASNDYSKERQFQQLNSVSDKEKMVTVIRDQETLRIHEQDVLTGDIIRLVEGMEIPGDGIIIDAAEVIIDESSMTGESHTIKKGTIQQCLRIKQEIENEGRELGEQDRYLIPSPALLSGTRVLEGEGLFMICVVGDHSCLGKIRASLEQDEDEITPLQDKLTQIAEDIGKLGLAAAILIVCVLLLRFTIERAIAGTWDNKYYGEIIKFFILGIVVLAVAIPEGLPLAVTLSLAFSVKKMMKDKNLVRKMYSCETMGGADQVCSDKTGTLTMNKMSLIQIWNNQIIEIQPHAKQQQIKQMILVEELFMQSICCNSSAELHPMQTGSKTEIALLEYVEKRGIDYQMYRGKYQIIKKVPFNSSRKRMSIIIKIGERSRLLVKGAAEYIVEGLTHFHDFNDKIHVISPEIRMSIEIAISSIAQQGLRTLCLAYRDLDGSEDLNVMNEKVYKVESERLTFLCIVGIMDTLREGVKEAVQQCKDAGIQVRMVTGDNKETAKAIAIQCGIIQENQVDAIIMDGPQFVTLIGGVVCKNCKTERCLCAKSQKDAQERKVEIRVDSIGDIDVFKNMYPKMLVLARSRPQDKYALVVGLKELGHVVAVTGDGTNDAPALKKADVGFAMGISGTQVAKDAAAIILMEDNFTDIVKAVMWGRNIYACIRKFLQFQLTVNIVAVGMTLITAAILKQDVLQPIQMLWVNLIMDSFASLALATEPPDPILLKDKPYGRDEYIVTRKMFKHIIGQSLFQMIVILIFVFSCEQWMPEYYDEFDQQSDFQQYYKYNMDYYPDSKIITNGRYRSADGQTAIYETIYDITQVPSRHFTIVFNLFVMLQVFNFFNARKLNDEFNIFKDVQNSTFFIAIVGLIVFFQILIVTFGGVAFQCYSHYGLQIVHWIICIVFGMIGWLVAIGLKYIPEDKVFDKFRLSFGKAKKDEEGKNIALHSSRVLALRRGLSARMSPRLYTVAKPADVSVSVGQIVIDD